MEQLSFRFDAARPAPGRHDRAIVGVVASGNLEVFVERKAPVDRCLVDVATAVRGFADVWAEVLADFVARRDAGGLHITINDGGARPDTVSLRLAQAARLIAMEDAP